MRKKLALQSELGLSERRESNIKGHPGGCGCHEESHESRGLLLLFPWPGFTLSVLTWTLAVAARLLVSGCVPLLEVALLCEDGSSYFCLKKFHCWPWQTGLVFTCPEFKAFMTHSQFSWNVVESYDGFYSHFCYLFIFDKSLNLLMSWFHPQKNRIIKVSIPEGNCELKWVYV